jgi:Domain of unknown function (DUF397)
MNTSVPINWRKSSRSGTTSNCVEVGWRKSSLSGSGSNCVEVAVSDPVSVRDSKNTSGPVLSFPTTTWSRFVSVLH